MDGPSAKSNARRAMSVAFRWGLGLASVSLAFVLAQTFVFYHLPLPFTSLALSAIAITFWYGGTMPGIFTALIAWLVRGYFFEPEVSAEARILYGLVFLVFALVMILVTRERNELEARVAERTAELTRRNDDLTRAQRAEASLRTVQAELAHASRVTILGQLTASIAHEITQPIATARNNARAAVNFLDKQPPDLAEVREALHCIVADTDRAGDIIDRIRDHTKKTPPRSDRFGLNEAINEVIVLARSEIAKNGVSAQMRLAEALFPVMGDRVQLQQVVMNLILNAVEAMSSVEVGARELSISTEQHQAGGVLVTVRDSGPGIDPEDLERVFEAFYSTKSSGVGIGLSICRSIIDAHAGRLWAEVNTPRGAVFRFTLPSAT